MTPETQPPGGIEKTNIIDSIVHDAKTDEVILTMVERRPWDDSDEQLFQLQEKLNAYVSFIMDGEMAEAYPALTTKLIRIRLECTTPPTETVRGFLEMVYEQLAFQGIIIDGVVSGGSCGSGCGCAG